MRLAALLAGVFGCFALPSEAFAQGRSDECGYVYPVTGYQADIGDLHISLPANDRLLVNGRLLAEHARADEPGSSEPWGDSANTARIGETADYVLILTTRTDCVAYSSSRIYVLDRNGRLRATSALWSEHYPFSFIPSSAGLVFSSDWFCVSSRAPPGRAYVYVLRPGETAFVQEERARDRVCTGDEHRNTSRVYFADMQPVMPSQ